MPNAQESIDVTDAARNGPRPRWPIVALLGVALAAGAWIGSSLRDGARRVERERCAANLKQIGQAMLLYGNEHRNLYPDSFATLARVPSRDGPIDLATFACPVGDSLAPATVDDADRGSYRLTADSMPSRVPGRQLWSAIMPSDAVAIEAPGRHAGGVHVLHIDGHVEFRQISDTRGATWADTQEDVIRGRPIRWPASQPTAR